MLDIRPDIRQLPDAGLPDIRQLPDAGLPDFLPKKIETFRRSSSSFLYMILGILFTCFIVCGSKCHFKAWKIVWFFIQNPAGLPDIRQLPDAGCRMFFIKYAGCRISGDRRPDNQHAGYPAKWKIRPDNPALPDIRPNPKNYTWYEYIPLSLYIYVYIYNII